MSNQATKGYKGIGMEGPIASWYAGMTRSRQAEFDAAARTVLERIAEGGSVLEVAPGPGYLALRLAQSGRYTVTGLDISRSFVKIARDNAAAAGVNVDFRHGNASQMPFGPASFDGIVCQAAFKNFSDPVGALDEMHRVLRPGGQAFIFDMRGDATDSDLDQAASEMGISKLNQSVVKLVFKTMLVRRAYTPEAFRQLVAQSRFGTCAIENDLIGMMVRLAK